MSGYTKLFGSILDSTVWHTPAHVRLVWITMLAMADRDGVVEASVPGLALRAGVERGHCEQALALFLSPDPDSRTPDYEGRRIEAVDGGWRLLNHGKYSDKLSSADKAEKNALRQKRWRERNAKRNASNAPVTPVTSRVAPCDASNDTQTQTQTQMHTKTQTRESGGARAYQHDLSTIQRVALAAYSAVGATAPMAMRGESPKALTGLVEPLRELSLRDRLPVERVAERLFQGFVASPRAKKAGYPIAWAVHNPNEYLAKSPMVSDFSHVDQTLDPTQLLADD